MSELLEKTLFSLRSFIASNDIDSVKISIDRGANTAAIIFYDRFEMSQTVRFDFEQDTEDTLAKKIVEAIRMLKRGGRK